MSNFARYRAKIINFLQLLSIYQKIAIGNSFVIIIGGIGGIMVTRHLVAQAEDVSLITLFSAIGIFLSITINTMIIRSAFKPLWELQKISSQINKQKIDQTNFPSHGSQYIANVINTLQTLIFELNEKNLALKKITQRAIYAQEEKRMRIARSLHDDTSQSLLTLLKIFENYSLHL